MVKAPQNWKNLQEDIPVFALCLNRELFVLAKHAVSLQCQLWQCQNSSVCFYCSYAMPQIMLPSTHTYSLELPSQVREISVPFSHPQTEVIGWKCRRKGWEGGTGNWSAIINFTFFECNRPLVQMGSTRHGDSLKPSALHKASASIWIPWFISLK